MKKKFILTLMLGALFCTGTAITVSAASSQKSDKTNLYYAPDITVDYENYSVDSVPLAIKGVKYRIFPAYAEDVYGNELAVTAKVYIHYLEPNKSLVTLEDGYATPNYYGVYTVEYSACDEFGNIGYATYDFTCDEVEELSLSLDGAFDDSVQVGKQAKIKGYSYLNGIGDVSVAIKATNETGVTYDLTDQTSFIPLYTGQYVISYECKDYNLTVTQSYTLQVTDNSDSVIYEDPTLPKYFIVGKEYTIPNVTCYNFASGSPSIVEPSIFVKYGNGEYQAIGDNKFTATTDGDITFKYSVTGDYKEYSSTAVDVGVTENALDMRKYFASNTAVCQANSDCITIEVKTEGERVEFINRVESHAFDFLFTIPNGYDNFEKLNLFLVNSVDETKTLKITYAKSGEKSSVIINDGERFKCDESFSFEKAITVSYREKEKTLRFGVGLTIDLSDFVGFNDERVYFSFSLEGIEGKSGINVVKIANQIFSDSTADGFEPKIYFETYPKGYETIGNTVTVDRIFVCDVLDPNFEVLYSIKTPSGDYVYDVNGVVLNEENADYRESYSFVVSEYGQYSVNMYVKDAVGNEELYAYTIRIEDLEGPTLSLTDEMETDLKIGESLTVSELAITDNKSDTFEVYAYIIKPNMTTEIVSIGTAYSFEKSGKYVLCYVVKDESGNATIVTHTFVVG